MKNNSPSDIIHKEVVIIGNGPSGISMSYMLTGNLPYVTSDEHPDELLSARLRPAVGQCLVNEDLEALSQGLEGRSTNPISLLLDSLLHPCADIGFEMEPLAEFRKSGKEIDHIVLGKGPPGGSWHKMDPHVLTLSLGSWMALPGLPFHSRDSGEKRAFACNVAKYYVQYVHQMHLTKYMRNNILVTSVTAIKPNKECCFCAERTKSETNNWVNRIDKDLVEMEENVEEKRPCFISNAINCFSSRFQRRNRPLRCCKRPREEFSEQSPTRKLKPEKELASLVRLSKRDRSKSTSLSCDSNIICDNFYSRSFNECSLVNSFRSLRNTFSLDFSRPAVPLTVPQNNACDCSNWLVEAYDTETGESTTYSCKYVVLANGASDSPNKLEISTRRRDPSWLVHDVRSLELMLDNYMRELIHCDEERRENVIDPVLIIGAGFSAADAVIATRGRNIPVIHVFRNKSADLNKQLPENMYPEYHKVHQMMQDGGSTYPLYTAYPEYTLTDFDEKCRTVILTSRTNEHLKLNVSFAAVLIGSRPDLSFLPNGFNLGVNKNLPIDCKTNTVDVDKMTHSVKECENMFAVGPLAGDNFVRFIPGGALAVVAHLYRNKLC